MARRKQQDPSLNGTVEEFITTEEERQHYINSMRDAAKTLSSAALRKGATISPLDPCGLDVVLDVVFGEEIDLLLEGGKDEEL